MLCATARANDIGEEVSCKYEDADIRISVFADDMSAVGDAGQIRKRIRNCMKMETLKMSMD